MATTRPTGRLPRDMQNWELALAVRGCETLTNLNPEPKVEKFMIGYEFRLRKELEARGVDLPETDGLEPNA